LSFDVLGRNRPVNTKKGQHLAIKIRYGAYVKEAASQHRKISLNELILEKQLDEDGNKVRVAKPKINLRTIDVYRLLQPYLTIRIMEQIKAVVPLALYLMLFQMIILRQGVNDAGIIVAGLFAVIIGLMFFMEGLNWNGTGYNLAC
jgi:hypothetical protein